MKLARWIGRSEDPFINVYAVFHAGLKQEGLVLEHDEDEEESNAAV
jgi:hypothetical protein